jgi:hypothetical protein
MVGTEKPNYCDIHRVVLLIRNINYALFAGCSPTKRGIIELSYQQHYFPPYTHQPVTSVTEFYLSTTIGTRSTGGESSAFALQGPNEDLLLLRDLT